MKCFLCLWLMVGSIAAQERWIGRNAFQVFPDHGEVGEESYCKALPRTIYSNLRWKPGDGCYAVFAHPVKLKSTLGPYDPKWQVVRIPDGMCDAVIDMGGERRFVWELFPDRCEARWSKQKKTKTGP